MAAPDSPEHVYLDFVERFAARLADEGFCLSGEPPVLSREHGEFEHRLSTRTARDNVPGELVEFNFAVQVHAPRYQAWLEQDPPLRELPVHSLIDSCGLAHLGVSDHRPWNIADPQWHAAQLDGLTALYHERIAPHFRRFEHPEGVAEYYAGGEGPPSPLMRVQIALCFGGPELARRTALAYRQGHPRFHADYLEELRRLDAEGLPEAFEWRGFGEGLALAERLFELELEPL